jgi:hypothetical protein
MTTAFLGFLATTLSRFGVAAAGDGLLWKSTVRQVDSTSQGPVVCRRVGDLCVQMAQLQETRSDPGW